MTEDESTTIEDPHDYISRRRLEDIFNARETLRQRRLQVSTDHRSGELPKLMTYRASLESYVQELHPLLITYEPGPEYWESYDFGDVTIEPQTFGGPLRYNSPDPEIIRLRGLKCLFDLPSPISAEFDYGQFEDVELTEISKKKLDRMVTVCNEFLVEIGVEIDLEDQPDDGFLDL